MNKMYEYTQCCFSKCSWQGPIENLLKHAEMWHQQFVRKMNKDNGFLFDFDDILEDAFLLSCDKGLYWFLLDQSALDSGIRRGVFAVGNAEICDYTVKIGQIDDESMTYFGPYLTTKDWQRFDLEWCYKSLETIYGVISTKTLEVYFGDYKLIDESQQHEDKDSWSFYDQQEDSWMLVRNDDDDDKPDCNYFKFNEFDCIACLGDGLNLAECPICTRDIPAHIITDSPASPDDDQSRLNDYSSCLNSQMDVVWSSNADDVLELSF